MEQGKVGRLLSQVKQQSQAVRSQLYPHGGGQQVLNPEEKPEFRQPLQFNLFSSNPLGSLQVDILKENGPRLPRGT